MFVGILLRESARDFGVEFESSRHREIFEISSRGVQKAIGSHFNFDSHFFLLSYDLGTLKLIATNFHVVFFLGPIRFWSGYGTVINYVEVVLKITDNGASLAITI